MEEKLKSNSNRVEHKLESQVRNLLIGLNVFGTASELKEVLRDMFTVYVVDSDDKEDRELKYSAFLTIEGLINNIEKINEAKLIEVFPE
jgi:hypothetical protein